MGDAIDERAQPRNCVAVFAVSDLEASLEHYRDRLGFEEAFRWGDPLYYAGVCRGAVTIHLNGAADRKDSVGRSALCLFVEDADATHRDLVGRGANVTVGIDDRPYGMRDFAVEDPDGNRLIFGNDLGLEV